MLHLTIWMNQPTFHQEGLFKEINDMQLDVDLTIWMNQPTFYQEDTFEAIKKVNQINLYVIYAKDLTTERINLGWTRDLSSYQYKILNQSGPIWDVVKTVWQRKETLHIVNGIWAEPAFAFALVLLKITKSKYIIYSEAPDPTVKRGVIKNFLRQKFGRWIAKSATGVLAVSHFAEKFFETLGFEKKHIYPFGYFEKTPNVDEKLEKKETIEFVFIGQLVTRKGVDILLEALLNFFEQYSELRLKIFGIGEEQSKLEAWVKNKNLEEKVKFLGVIPSKEIASYLIKSDLLILPSRWDGWGMVVNEALAVGLPVIVSNQCGVSDVVENDLTGYIFHSENVEDLKNCIAKFLHRRSEWQLFREAAKKTGQCLSVETVVPYLIDSLTRMLTNEPNKPIAPWIKNKRGKP